MIDGVIIKKLETYEDERGWLSEIYRNDEVDYQPVMGYTSMTKPSMVRGPHEHKGQTDCFVFVGPGILRLYLWDNRKDSPTFGEEFAEDLGENNKTMVIVPPGVVHGYKCVSATAGWVTNLTDKLYKGKDKAEEIDEIRWEDDKESPYQIN